MNATLPPSTPETLRSALARAAGDLEKQSPPSNAKAASAAFAVGGASLPESLMQAIEQRRAPSPNRARRFAWAGGGLAALTLSMAVALLLMAPRDDLPVARTELATAFMPVGDAQRWPQLMRDAAEPGRAWVVPTELPTESLAAMGLPYDPAHAGEPVRAELLVHANGDVLAVRFVR
jgi:hypothetical protein